MIMRLASFFVLSLAVHAAALVYPVSFGGKTQVELVHVTILPIERELPSGSGNSGNPAPRAGSNPAARTSRAQHKVESKPDRAPEPNVLATEAPTTTSDDGGIPLVTATAKTNESPGARTSGLKNNRGHGSAAEAGEAGTGGNGSGSSGTGSGRGSGQGPWANGTAVTQARYRDTPTPDYPDSARREGREGRVLVRVLVDDQGRSKRVEINSSSGSDALDRAAAEAIQRWRFHPARQGDQPVESWLRIPIEFRLADAKPR